MSSKIKVDSIETVSGSGTISIPTGNNLSVGGTSTFTGASTFGEIRPNNIASTSGTNAMTIAAGGQVTFATNPAGLSNTPSFYVTKNDSNQSISQATNTVVTFNHEIYDTDNKFDTSTSRFTPGVAGKYFLFASGQCTGSFGSNSTLFISIRKNGSGFALVETRVPSGSHSFSVSVSTIGVSNTTDYFDVSMYNGSGTPPIRAGDSFTFFGGYKLIGV